MATEKEMQISRVDQLRLEALRIASGRIPQHTSTPEITATAEEFFKFLNPAAPVVPEKKSESDSTKDPKGNA